MVLDSTKELGRIIGESTNSQEDIKTNLSPDEEAGSLVIKNTENIKVTGQVTITKKVYDEASFIIDHPVQGELDSSTLKIDGGYNEGNTFPLEFPIKWNFIKNH